MPADCAIALADRSRLPLPRLAVLLSSREKAETLTHIRPERRWRTVASRLLTKYLVAGPVAQPFRRVGAREIEAIDGAALASIEHLSGVARAYTAPVIIREGHICSGVSASSSHCGFYTASCIGSGRIGLDLERIEPRRPEFYQHTFSGEEQDWARWIAAGNAASVEVAFTLLWSVKEALLKATGRRDLSLWSFPGLTVSVGDSLRPVLQPNTCEELLSAPGRIRDHCLSRNLSRTFEIAALRLNDMILATVQY